MLHIHEHRLTLEYNNIIRLNIVLNMMKRNYVRFILSCILTLSLVHFVTHLAAYLKYDNGIKFLSREQCSDVYVLNKTIHEFEELNNYLRVCDREETSGANNALSARVCGSCHLPVFMEGNKPFIALASFAGSGNSWTRELLESMTGLYTGSIYADVFGKFPGSGQCPHRGGVYIIKTHRYDNLTEHNDCRKMQAGTIFYQTAMFILRNPYGAILSKFNLANTGNKVGVAPRVKFHSEKWQNHVRNAVPEWKQMTLGWLAKFERPVHVIVYEELQTRTVSELFKIGQFLCLNISYLDFHCATKCLKPKYHRVKPAWMKTSNLYDDELRKVVNDAINEVINNLVNKHHLNYHDIIEALGKYVY